MLLLSVMGSSKRDKQKGVILPADDRDFVDYLRKITKSADAEEQIRRLTDQQLLASCNSIAPIAGAVVQYAKDTEWLIKGILPKGALILVGGEPKHAQKSQLMLSLAVALTDPSCQSDFLGAFPILCHGRAVVINLEDGRDRLLRRVRDHGVQPGDPRPLHVMWRTEGLMFIYEWLLRSADPARIIIVDPFVELAGGIAEFDENNAADVTALLKIFRDISQETGATFLIIHHTRKDGDRMRGSSALEAACDGWWFLRRCGRHHRMQLTLRDGSIGEIDYEVRYAEQCCRAEAISGLRLGHTAWKRPKVSPHPSAADGVEPDFRREVLDALNGLSEPASRNAIADVVGRNKKKVLLVLDDLTKEGLAVRVGEGAHPKLIGAQRAELVGSDTVSQFISEQ